MDEKYNVDFFKENPQNTKLIFQKLPIHMRRRAMSHKPNRMPRILREAHKAQVEVHISSL